MKSLTTKSFKASQFIGRNQLLQKTFSSRALSFGLLRYSNDRPGKYQATRPDLIRLSSPLHYKFTKGPENETAESKKEESMKLDDKEVESVNKMLETASKASKTFVKFYVFYCICWICLTSYFWYYHFTDPFEFLNNNGYTRNVYNSESNNYINVLDPTHYIGSTAAQNTPYFKEKHNFHYYFLNSASKEHISTMFIVKLLDVRMILASF